MSNKQKKMTPEVRFSGFNDDWEQCKLGNVTEKIGSGKTPKGGNATYQTEGVPLIRSQNIFNNRFNQNDVAYISKKTDDEMKNSRVYTGDILLNITGASIGRSAVYRQKMAANVNQHVCIIRPKKEYYSDFIQLNISSSKGQREIYLNQAGGGREGLNFQQISKISFFYPSVEEQQKIGSFFKQLDDTIALHQRKLELLNQLKKAYLQQMFPTNGEINPKVRFANFTNVWEQRKLGEELSLLKDGTHGTHIDTENGPYLLSAKNIKNGRVNITPADRNISIEEFNKIHTNFSLQTGDVLLTIVGSIGETAVLNNADNITFQRSVAYLRSKSMNSQFLYTIISGPLFQKELKNRQVVSAQPGIYLGDLAKIDITIPDIVEQTAIASFFKQLDDTIALHQNKIETIKKIKKAFLQKMFI